MKCGDIFVYNVENTTLSDAMMCIAKNTDRFGSIFRFYLFQNKIVKLYETASFNKNYFDYIELV